MGKEYIQILDVSIRNEKQSDKVFKALANKTRRNILRMLSKGPMSIKSLSFLLETPISTISEHVSILLKSGVVSVVKQVSDRGQSKVISRQYEKIAINLIDRSSKASSKDNYVLDIPIGSYTSFSAGSMCGMICKDGYIGARDNPNCFYAINRFHAQLIWFGGCGYLEYAIPIDKNELNAVNSITFSLELCSESPGYNEDWKSDIYFEVNGVNVGTFTSLGDYGARRGNLTPAWWINSTSYGLLKTLEIKNDGTFIDGVIVSNITPANLRLEHSDLLIFRFGVKENAKNKGGLNIFGDNFGDYPQNIILTISHK